MNRSYFKIVFPGLFVLTGMLGCSDLDQDLPAGVENPKVVDSEFGAVSLYRGVMAMFSRRYPSYVVSTGLFTDELHDAGQVLSQYAGLIVNSVDGRGEVSNEGSYSSLHAVRNSADQAIAMLHRHGQGRYDHLISELYSVKAFSMLYLSELYCSGIPLSTVDFEEDYTYTRGYTTVELLNIIDHIFDSAISFSGDSLRYNILASIGKARTKMNLGLYTDAEAILENVVASGTYSYNLPYSSVGSSFSSHSFLNMYTVPRNEGINGLDFRVADPRVRYMFVEVSTRSGDSVFSAIKYQLQGNNPSIVIASTVEAWLMMAELTLASGTDEWIDILNNLRTDGTYTVNIAGDTLWNRGLGGIDGLKPLSKPTDHSLFVDLIFKERAFWLYLTGHRQGDLRRLIRQYERDPNSVYPTGFYGVGGATFYSRYGDRIVMPVPIQEEDQNPLYSGCISEGA